MNLSFDLSDAEIKGLKLLNNEISEEITKKLIVNAVKQLLVKTGPALPARSEIYDSTVGLEAKQADFSVCAFLLLASKHSADVVELRQLLDHHKINNQTVDQLLESYEKFKDELCGRLSKQGNSHNIPHWNSVSVEVQQQTNFNNLVYKINLQSFDHQTGKNKIIQEVFCNPEELQLFIQKLKEVERHCERLSK